jgi:hypothetical protein
MISVETLNRSGERLGRPLGVCGKSLNSNEPRSLGNLLTSMVPLLCPVIKVEAEPLDLGHRHRLAVRGYHLGEVFGKCINLFLEEEKGGTDGTQLPFVNDKGELLHGVGSASQLVLSGYWWMRRKQGSCHEEIIIQQREACSTGPNEDSLNEPALLGPCWTPRLPTGTPLPWNTTKGSMGQQELKASVGWQ